MSGRGHKHYYDPRDPNYSGQRSSDTSGPNKLGFDTQELLAQMDLGPNHPRKNTLYKRTTLH